MTSWDYDKAALVDTSSHNKPLQRRQSMGEVLMMNKRAARLERAATKVKEDLIIRRANKKNSVASGVASIGVKSALLLGK